jgi:pimeloyl-ACP methyl ester carboxylesterase
MGRGQLRLIDHLGLDRVHLVGHSTGGTIAQVLAADHSDRVASLVLGATWARLDARLRKLFVFRKQALYEQVGFDRRSASRHTPQEIAAARIDALLTYEAKENSIFSSGQKASIHRRVRAVRCC